MNFRTALLILLLSSTAFAKPSKKAKHPPVPKQNNVLVMGKTVLGVMSNTETCTAVAKALTAYIPTVSFDCVTGK